MKRPRFEPHAGIAVALTPLLLALTLGLAGCGGGEENRIASARAYLQKNEVDSAKIELKSLLQDKPGSGQARLLYGMLLVESGEPVNGEAELRRALELHQPESDVLPALARAMMVQGKARDVVLQFAKTDLSDPKAAAELKIQIASAHLVGADYRAAQAAIEAGLARAPEHVPSLVLKARIVFLHGQTDSAMGLVDALIQRVPDSPGAWALRGELLAAKGVDITEVVQTYRKSLALDPKQATVQGLLVGALLQQKDLEAAGKQMVELRRYSPQSPPTFFYETMLAIALHDFKRAREAAQQLLRLAPSDPRVLVLAGQTELALNSVVQAEALFGKAVALAPTLAVARRQLALTYLRTGQGERALNALKPLLDGNQSDPQAFALAGQAHLVMGDNKRADSYFALAAKTKPDDLQLRALRALTNLARGQESALAELQTVASGDIGGRVDLALISLRMQRGEYDQALKAIDELAKKAPAHAMPDYLRGQVARQRKDNVAARAAFERSLAKDAGYLPSLNTLASMDMADGKPEAARARFEALYASRPKDIGVMMNLAKIRGQAGAPAEEVKALLDEAVRLRPDDVDARVALIDALLEVGDYKAALTAGQAGLAALPDNPEILDRIGRALQASGDFGQAISIYGRMVNLQPRSLDAQMRLINAQAAGGASAAALAGARKVLEMSPNHQPAQEAIIVLAMREKQPALALEQARSIQTQQPKQALGYLLEGDIAAVQKDREGAAAAYRKALAVQPTSASAIRLHRQLLDNGKTADADQLASQWHRDHPDDAAFSIYIGDKAVARSDWTGASAAFGSAIEQQPNNIIALNNQAMVLLRQGKPGALRLIEKAIHLAPNQPAVLDTLAAVLVSENQVPRAIEAQSKAVRLAPDAPIYRLGLAKLMVQTDKKDAARAELEILAKLGSKFSRQAEVSDLLKSLGG